jgi:two-component system, NarL family, nitrate/nitrite response regulator NarL
MEQSCNGKDIRIAIIDPQQLFVDPICALLNNEPDLLVIGHASDRRGALGLAGMRPHIILLEIALGEDNALDFLPDLIRVAEGARILVVTGVTDTESFVRAVRAGAMGILAKTEPATRLLQAIRKIHRGELWVGRSIMARVLDTIWQETDIQPKNPEQAKIATLTSRELEVVALLGEALKSKQIGERLFISETTVRHHLTSIFGKLGVADRLELIIYAYQHGLAPTTSRGPLTQQMKFNLDKPVSRTNSPNSRIINGTFGQKC